MYKKRFFCIDAHTCGNPVRVVVGGAPDLHGENMVERRNDFLLHHDWIRKSLMFEPRGHDMMSGSIIYPPIKAENDFSVLFIETSGCLPMCGHGTIGTVTVAIEEGLIKPKVPGVIRMEAPAGLIEISYQTDQKNKVTSVKLINIPSFLLSENINVECALGDITVDVAYGGNFYAIIDSQQNFRGIKYYTADQLITWSREIRQFINANYQFVHPLIPEINGCSHVLWTGACIDPTSSARNAVFYGDKAIDRSPCGTGTSARMAQWFAKGKLQIDQPFIHESYIGSKFIGRVESTAQLGALKAIIPSIEGWAKIYGYNTILVDPDDDPYAGGFQVI